ncbi:MAG: ATP-binding protein [Clostridiales bacterium]|nr:ATP-binding protein [Clostridia bacterium]MCR5353255.1 ATP-binding protein [Clostridiales bacterium]
MTNENNNLIKLNFSGRIDSGNASQVEKEVFEKLDGKEGACVEIDASDLAYISSAGLRVILRIKKTFPEMKIVNVNSDVYEILDMTGFTEMMAVEKAYRVITVEGCEVIGQGANGTIYRIDRDNVVKVYNNADALADIQHEREVARLALILGIPTAISYDVVKVGESYGSVFELLNARSFSKILSTEPDKMDWCVKEYVKMLKRIHATEVPEGKLPDMKETALSWANFVKDYLPEEEGKKLVSLVEKIPFDNHMIHGDYHTKNLELQDDEVLLIDMDTLAIGNPIFELASMYNAYIGFSETNHENIKTFQGFDFETGSTFWHKALASYLGTNCETKIREVEDKARILGYTRLVRRSIRRGGLDSEFEKKNIEFWKAELIGLIKKTDTLCFEPNELDIEATPENLSEVQAFVEEKIEAEDCSPKAAMQIGVAVEEIFINIASYAYAPEKGKATVRIEVSNDPLAVSITFIDHGVPYDPLEKTDPDITLSAEEREIGGLGIFMTKKMMDDVKYEYKDGQNILTLKKTL